MGDGARCLTKMMMISGSQHLYHWNPPSFPFPSWHITRQSWPQMPSWEWPKEAPPDTLQQLLGKKEKCVHLGRQVLAYQHLLPIFLRRRRRSRKDIKTLMVEGYEVEVFRSESPPDPSSSAFDSSIYIGFTSISLSLGVFLSVIYNKWGGPVKDEYFLMGGLNEWREGGWICFGGTKPKLKKTIGRRRGPNIKTTTTTTRCEDETKNCKEMPTPCR